MTDAHEDLFAALRAYGERDTEPLGSPEGPPSTWLWTYSDHLVRTKSYRYRRHVTNHRFEFMRTDEDGDRLDATLVVGFHDGEMVPDDRPAYLLHHPGVYVRIYHLKPHHERDCRHDAKEIDSYWLTTGREVLSVDQLLANVEQAMEIVLAEGESVRSERRQHIATTGEDYWNDDPDLEATSLDRFATEA